MKRFLLSLASVVMLCNIHAADTWQVPDEELHYNVRFKWGLIDANVGIATVTTLSIPGSGQFRATLSGKSIDLLGHYYAVGDTVQASMLHGSLSLAKNERVSMEHGEFAIETITGNATGPSSDGPVVAHLQDGKVIRSRISEYGSGLTIDLLSVFYYIRQIEYPEFQPGQQFAINLSNGNQIEKLHIRYLGTDNVDVNGVSYTGAFHISLTFGGLSSSKIDSMEVWIADNGQHIPVKINGSLSVGHVECRYINSETYNAITSGQ